MADPRVINWIKDAAAKTGADPVALIATSLTENGAREGLTPGDNGTSFGYFQMHRGGALGNNSPQWAATPAVALNRAQEFKRLQVHGGKGAAAVQRPADPAGYAAKVQENLAEARRLLGSATPQPRLVTSHLQSTPATSDDANIGNALIQSILDSNAELAGIAPITLPAMTMPQAAAPTPTLTTPKTKQQPSLIPNGRVDTIASPRIIGTPHSGTHTLGNWQSDNAVDISMPVGTPIRAATDGVIGSRIGSLGSGNPRFAGLRVNLQGSGEAFYYAHLSKLAVKAGQRVKKGQIIGYSGSANGVSHLHLGVQKGDPRRYA